MSTVAPAVVEIEFPDTDGKPMAESDAQAIPLMYAVTSLRDHFLHDEKVYVSGNLLIYYDPADSGASVSPDAFVVFGVADRIRPSYKVWEEQGKAPDFVLEITSRSTRREDRGRKRALYGSLGVKEYWQYDPTGDYLAPVLWGGRLRDGTYQELPPRWLDDDTLSVRSAVLDLDVRVVAGELRFHDPRSGEYLLTLTESNEARTRERQARQRAEQGWQRAEQQRQLAEQQRQLAEQQQQLAERERDREQRERRRAEQARRAADARVAELEALLRRVQGDGSGRGA